MLGRFEDVAALDATTLRALLGSEHPQERLWAIWELALRAGRDGELSPLLEQLSRDPSPGIRRMLVVVLGGHGELDLVVALGRHDPDALVRAQAMQLVTRLAAAGSVEAAVVTESFAREVPEVRTAIVAAIGPGAPEWLEWLAQDALQGPPELGLEAFEAVLRVGTRKSRDRALHWIAKARGELAMRAWERWPQVMPAGEIVEMLAGKPAPLRVVAIRLIEAIPIGELERLTAPSTPAIFEAVRDRHDFGSAPISLLARGVLAGFAVRYLEQLADQLAALADPALSAPGAELAGLLAELRAHCAARVAAVTAGQLLPDEQPAHRWPARARYTAVIDGCDRLLRP